MDMDHGAIVEMNLCEIFHVGQPDSLGWIAKPYDQESEDGCLTARGLVKGG